MNNPSAHQAPPPVVMIAGATGTIGCRMPSVLKLLGCRVISVSRKIFDLTSAGETGTALLIGKPDIVIDATSSLGGNGVHAFRDKMAVSMNLIHACAAAGIRLVQLEAPPVIWPWEDPHPIRAFLAAQNALSLLREEYSIQHRLNFLALKIPMVYNADARRPDALSVIAASVCKGKKDASEVVSIPLNEKQPVSMIHVSDAATAIVDQALSEVEGHRWISPPAYVPCVDLVRAAVTEAGFTGTVKYGSMGFLPTNEGLLPDYKLTARFRIEMVDGVRMMVRQMLEPPPPRGVGGALRTVSATNPISKTPSKSGSSRP